MTTLEIGPKVALSFLSMARLVGDRRARGSILAWVRPTLATVWAAGINFRPKPPILAALIRPDGALETC